MKFFGSTLIVVAILVSSCGSGTSEAEQFARNQGLIKAINEGNQSQFDRILAEGADPNTRDEEGTPAIIVAANFGSQEMVQGLIENGANINAKRENYYYSTALMEIAARGDTSMAKLLLEAGASVSARDTFGDPAINWAAYYGQIPFVKMLLSYGASWNLKSKHGTALEVAMKQWHDPLVEYLIEQGAGTPLSGEALELVTAVKAKDAEQVARLLESPDIATNLTDQVGTPLLVLAASAGAAEIVQLLLDNGAIVDQMNRVGQTALSRAAYFGYPAICKQLIEAKADINLAGEQYQLTPLISAANSGQVDVAKLLAEQGANLDKQDAISGFTALMFATAYGYEDMVALLLEAGANPYVKSNDGASLFDMLSFSRNTRIQALLEAYMQNQ